MEKKDGLTKVLSICGSILAWIPLIAPFIFGALALVTRGRFLFDYLMPAELFPVALAGSALLLWAAVRAHHYRAWIGWSLVAALLLLVGGQALAEVTGLASGEIEPSGLPWVLVMGSLVAFTLALAFVGIGGILLSRDLFRQV